MNDIIMNDRIFYEMYNVLTKESAVLPIEKGADKEIVTRMFYQLAREGWVMVKPLSLKGGE